MSLGSLARYDDAEDEIRDEDHDLVLHKPPPSVQPAAAAVNMVAATQNALETPVPALPSPPVELKPSPSNADGHTKATGLLSLGAYGDMSDDDMSESEEEGDQPPPKIISNQPIVVPPIKPATATTTASANKVKPDKKNSSGKQSVINLGLYDVSTVLHSEGKEGATNSPKPQSVSLPPEPEGRCSKSLQEKIANMIEKKKHGNLNMSEYIQKNKEFRNPSIYEKLISYIGIDEHGTNFPKKLYDPSIWGPESYYDELAKKQREYHREKEKEKAKKTQVEFINSTKKPTSTASSLASSISSSVPEKKSKWDQKAPPPPKIVVGQAKIITGPPKIPASVQAALKNLNTKPS